MSGRTLRQRPGRFVSKLGIVGIAVVVPSLLRNPHAILDGVVLAMMVLAVCGVARQIAALLSIALVAAAFPPFAWPTYWICLSPLAWIWRDGNACGSTRRCCIEALFVGFAMAWLSTAFVRDAVPALAGLAHGAGCLLFGMQIVGIAAAVRLLRHKPLVVSAVVTAVVATCGELLQSRFGVAWEVMSISLPAAPTPVAQWAHFATPFGVSLIIYLVNFLCIPMRPISHSPGPLLAFGVGAAAWIGGLLIASNVPVAPLPFSAMLVQPHVRQIATEFYRPWLVLDRITQANLSTDGPVDLIVWPEVALAPSVRNRPVSDSISTDDQLTLPAFVAKYLPRYRTTALVGVSLSEPDTAIRYGLPVQEMRTSNCACLASPSGEIVSYEKLALVPMKEGLPAWLDRPWFRSHILRVFDMDAPLSSGREFKVLPFTSRTGRPVLIAVSICYESYLYWLPQYRKSVEADAIIHLVYDGNFANYPGYSTRQRWACQFRAIETRKWNLVCMTWDGSAAIDPRGNVVRRLFDDRAALRTDLPGMGEPIAPSLSDAARACN